MDLSDEDSIATTCLYTEMTLKNERFGPKFPVLQPLAKPSEKDPTTSRAKEVDIECL